MQAVFLMGMPGCGKGTQANLLAECLGFFHFETNKIIRKKFEEFPDDPKVKLTKEQYFGGKWIEPRIIVKWSKEALKTIDPSSTSIVFDGALRTLFEAEKLVPFVKDLYGKSNVKALLLILSKAEALQRISQRLICNRCGYVIPPDSLAGIKVGDMCPKAGCQGNIVKRELDNPALFKSRLKEYEERTLPVLAYLKREVEFHEVDGAKSVGEIHNSIKRLLK